MNDAPLVWQAVEQAVKIGLATRKVEEIRRLFAICEECELWRGLTCERVCKSCNRQDGRREFLRLLIHRDQMCREWG
jgi:hypothetical protein